MALGVRLDATRPRSPRVVLPAVADRAGAQDVQRPSTEPPVASLWAISGASQHLYVWGSPAIVPRIPRSTSSSTMNDVGGISYASASACDSPGKLPRGLARRTSSTRSRMSGFASRPPLRAAFCGIAIPAVQLLTPCGGVENDPGVMSSVSSRGSEPQQHADVLLATDGLEPALPLELLDHQERVARIAALDDGLDRLKNIKPVALDPVEVDSGQARLTDAVEDGGAFLGAEPAGQEQRSEHIFLGREILRDDLWRSCRLLLRHLERSGDRAVIRVRLDPVAEALLLASLQAVPGRRGSPFRAETGSGRPAGSRPPPEHERRPAGAG